MGMFDMMQGAMGTGIRAQPQGGQKMMGQMPQRGGIGPSPMSQMRNKGQMGNMMRGGMQRPIPRPMQEQMPQVPQGNMPMKQMPMRQPMPQKQMPDLSQYMQQGQAAGNNMDWMQQPGAISPEYQQPMGPSPNGLQELLARMKMGNTGINGGYAGNPIEMNRNMMMNKRMPQY